MAEIVNALVLGIIEGVTEFLPISSTGHLILAGEALGFKGELAHSFDIIIQLGAIGAVVYLYYRRFLDLFDFSRGTAAECGFRGLVGISKLLLACVPAFVCGGALHGLIKQHLFSPLNVALALIFGGVVMIVIERIGTRPYVSQVEDITYAKCLWVGFFQCLALWPGMSRAACTIIGGMLVGLPRKVAAEFSFLVAVPTMVAATAFEVLKSYTHFNLDAIYILMLGFVVSFVMAVFAIKIFIGILSRYNLSPFGWYRIALGALVLWILY